MRMLLRETVLRTVLLRDVEAADELQCNGQIRGPDFGPLIF